MAGRTTFELRAGSFQESDVVVRAVRGEEALSNPYAFDVEFYPRGDPLDLAEICASEAVLTVRRPDGTERYAHGIVGSVRMVDLVGSTPVYLARIVPALERLRHMERSRIFQSMSVTDVVKQVLDEAGIAQRWAVTADYPEREYCVQYRESDLDFVSRLLEDAGIFYFFEHDSDGHTIVLADDVSAAQDDGTRLPVKFAQDDDGALEDVRVLRLDRRKRAAIGKLSLREFDFLNPGLDNAAQAKGQESGDTEWYEYPGGYDDADAGTALAQVRLDEQQSGARSQSGQSSCITFKPGGIFEATDHPDDSYNNRLLLVRVAHEAIQDGDAEVEGGMLFTYRNTFDAVSADGPYRPERKTTWPSAFPTTATVVGSSGEEIYPDSHARVKVQFHWDRDGQNDDKSTCWIRCAQSWGGAGWGALALPRIGQEVVVKFLGGDPDQPLVTGATYNGANPTPLSLPEDKTKSVTRSDSSPGGGGSNELRFEDQAGGEGVFLHAQRDKNIEVLADKAQTVRHDEALAVAKDRSITVSGQQQLSVTGSDTSRVEGDQTLSVSGNRTTRVTATHEETVTGSQALVVSGTRQLVVTQQSSEVVGGASAMTVGNAYAISVVGAMNVVVGGALSRTIAQTSGEDVAGLRGEHVNGNSSLSVGSDFNSTVNGTLIVLTKGDQAEDLGGSCGIGVDKQVLWKPHQLELEAEKKFTIIVNGKAALQIDDSGNMTFGAKAFVVKASSELTLKGGKIQLDGADSASSASADLKKLDPAKGDRASVDVALKFEDGTAVANEWISAKFADGTVRSGKTDRSGKATIFGPKEGKVKISLIKRDKSGWGS
jgi:type VI secretion system secreted protein VgrG